MEKTQITWFSKLLLKLWPQLFFRRFAHEKGIRNPLFSDAHTLFGKTERIGFFPLNGNSGRGFIMVLDGKTSLWFFQNGDHFEYDGFEMGEYEKGDVTIFDRLP